MVTLSKVASKASLALDLPPSCVQFCPSHAAYLVTGTYNLQQDSPGTCTGAPQARNGSLVVVRIDGDQLSVCSSLTHSHVADSGSASIKAQTILQPSALLDLRFHPRQREHPGLLAAVSSTGMLAMFCLDPTLSPTAPLHQLAHSKCQDLEDDVLFLQCSWHPVLRNVIAVTTSHGAARLLHLDQDWKIRGFTDLDICNSLEAWSVAWSPLDGDGPHISIYCGGDDSSLRYTLCSDRLDMPFRPATAKGHHGAGVTAILPLALHAADGGRLVVTGSYDDHLRLLAIHDLDKTHGAKRVRLVCETNLGGGVWRLGLVDTRVRDDGSRRVRILASCMHAGARLVEMTSKTDGLHWSCTILSRFDEHKSMNYASDCVAALDGGGILCVSTSFYDKLLCLWEHRG